MNPKITKAPEVKNDLMIRGENIQRVYQYYTNQTLLVNRRYQRKLVWTVEEKKSFIDSISRGYPVPLFLLAEINQKGADKFEIIDGMQRMNAITSFIEQEFDLDGNYFDLEAMVETKLLKDTDVLIQKTPKLDRQACSKIAGYVLPLSVYRINNNSEIDTIFRRINSGGRRLSRHEIRQAGTTGNFATLVRDISARLRGDVSATDTLLLNNMKEISITSKELSYGINVDNIFWVKQYIISRDKVRESRDEELVTDLLAYMLLEPKPSSSSEFLDNYFGIYETAAEEERFNNIENELLKRTPEVVTAQFIRVFDQIKLIIEKSNKPFNTLILNDAGPNVPRYFQCVFLALHELLINEGMVIKNHEKLAKKLDGIGSNINIGGGGGRWSAAERQKNVNAVKGIINVSQLFKKRQEEDPAIDSWTTEFENILMQSFTEQSLYDFKQGFHSLDKIGDFNLDLFQKVIKTLTAMANHNPGAIGYVLIGIADNVKDAKRINELHAITPTVFSKFNITGIQGEAEKYHKTLDAYFQTMMQYLKKEPISETIKSQISKDIRLVRYFDKTVLVFRVKAGKEPAMYDKKYYTRNGPNTEEVMSEGFAELFRRFFS